LGTKHTQLYGRIKALAVHCQARYQVVDATCVGAGGLAESEVVAGFDPIEGMREVF
jgi:hypothetical protein